MKLTVLSGKGGVGKSSIASSLAVLLAEQYQVVAVDCDVDAPNLGLCLGLTPEDFKQTPVSTTEVAKFTGQSVPKPQACVKACEFSAIYLEDGQPQVNPYLCEGCGTCEIVCPKNSVEINPVENGWVGVAHGDFPVVGGQLKTGQSGSGEIVALVKQKAEELEHQVMVTDSAAGIGCPVIASVKGSDFVVAVTEPTPSALSDLDRALQVVDHFGIPRGLVVNKADINPGFTSQIQEFTQTHDLPILGQLPYDMDFVNALVNLQPPVVYQPKFRPLFQAIIEKIPNDLKP